MALPAKHPLPAGEFVNSRTIFQDRIIFVAYVNHQPSNSTSWHVRRSESKECCYYQIVSVHITL